MSGHGGRRPGAHTWIPRAAVCACPVAGDRLDELLQGALITRLLAFVQSRRHGVWEEEAVGSGIESGDRVGSGWTCTGARARGERGPEDGRWRVGGEVMGKSMRPWQGERRAKKGKGEGFLVQT